MASVNKVILVGNLGKDQEKIKLRLMSFVAKDSTTGCWNWTGAKSRGYGILSSGWKNSPYKAHRISYQLFVGEIPNGMIIRHRCDNPACVNPDHLQIGTQRDNVMDMVSRGRANPISLKNLRPGEPGVIGAGRNTNKEIDCGLS